MTTCPSSADHLDLHKSSFSSANHLRDHGSSPTNDSCDRRRGFPDHVKIQ
jgi:hypothetical protein